MKLFYSLLISIPFLIPQASAQEEDLLARRIITLWQEGQKAYALSQAQQFISDYPDHALKDQFCLLVGELLIEKKSFGRAIYYFDKIASDEIKKKSYPSLFKALKNAKKYDLLYQRTSKLLERSKEAIILLFHADALIYSDLAHKKHGRDLSETQALKIYKALSKSPYSFEALMGQVSLLKSKGKRSEAIKALEQLIETNPDHRQRAYFEIALLEQRLAPEKAISALKNVIETPGVLQQKGVLLMGALLLQNSPEKLIEDQDKLGSLLDGLALKKLQAYIGLAHFEKGNIKEALKYLSQAKHPKINNASTLIASLACAYQEKAFDLFETFYTSYQALSSISQKTEKILLWRGLLHKEQSPDLALESFLLLIQQFPQSEEAELARIEKEAISFQQLENVDSLYALYQQYTLSPQALYAPKAFQYATELTYTILEKKTLNYSDIENLLQNLEESLILAEQYQAKLYPNAYLGYLKTLQALGRTSSYDIAVKEILKKSVNQPKVLAKIHRFLASIAQKNNDQAAYVFHLERALASSENSKDALAVHMRLFNFYLQEEKLNQEQAALHLRAAYQIDKEAIKENNLKWLALHDFAKISSFMEGLDHPPLKASLLWSDAEISKEIFHRLVAIDPKDSSFQIKLAKIYLWMEETKEAESIANNLDRSNPEVLSILLSSYEQQGRLKDAEEVLKILMRKGSSKDYLEPLYRLATRSLSEGNLSPSERNLAISWLDLIVQHKNVLSEPIHLNAGIEWAKEAAKSKGYSIENHLENLYRIKEAFTSDQSIQDKDYQKQLMENQDKKELFETYQIYLKSVIAKLEAQEAKRRGKFKEAQFKQELADILEQTLQKQSLKTNSYLQKKISYHPSEEASTF